jgi:hypothetical protein
METSGSSETSVVSYQDVRCHIPNDSYYHIPPIFTLQHKLPFVGMFSIFGTSYSVFFTKYNFGDKIRVDDVCQDMQHV